MPKNRGFKNHWTPLVAEMMAKYNRKTAIVYNTIQLYRKDRLAHLKLAHQQAKAEGYIYGAKLVRGAYMEKEAKRAKKMKYENPIQDSKEHTDRDYDLSVQYCIENINEISVCVATHNEYSCLKAVQLIEAHKIDKADNKIFFSQLFGMSDHISFNLAKAGYNVAKYMPLRTSKRSDPLFG